MKSGMKSLLESLKARSEAFALIILFIVSVGTRFIFLGYSDYIGDEHKAFYQPADDQTMADFFLSRRKGPMQFVFSHIPYLITGDFRNELAQRIPFATASVAAVFVFYFMLKEITGKKFVSFFAAFLLSINGFIVGFGRIAQYQNLNLLFSFSSVLFYAKFSKAEGQEAMKLSLLGTLMFALSLLSHWDVIFILPPVIVFFIKFLRNKKVNKNFKLQLTLLNLYFGVFLLMPFLSSFGIYQLGSEENLRYFNRRVSTDSADVSRYKLLIELYNPFLTYYFLVGFGILGALLVKRTWIFSLWFLFAYFVFFQFVRKPGTHIYNFIIPAIVLSSFSVDFILSKSRGILKALAILPLILFSAFLIYQAYWVYIDHTGDYPWRPKTLYDFTAETRSKRKKQMKNDFYPVLTTPTYTIEQKLPLFGFPHSRKWNEINAFINEQNALNNELLGYVSNEAKTISDWYMDVKRDAEGEFYVIGIKKPLSFVNDWKMPQYSGKYTVKEFVDSYGRSLARIYRVRPKN